MIYKYDNKNLNYKDITKTVLIGGLLIVLTLTTWIAFFTLRNVSDIKHISQETKAIIIKEANKENEFNKERLRAYILELNIRYPHIVLAQAELETGGFKSHIFKTNNNIFGMKEATKRPSTNKGTENGHAYYTDWKESVQDYALFAAAYLNDLKSESEYYDYLGLNYAEDKNYVNKLKEIIKKNNRLN